jgi:TetR/AcrR family transcriptional repressor of nem operon
MAKTRSDTTEKRILDVAERLVQTRGFNAFSYADIAAPLKMTKAGLHYHFPSKAVLGRRLVERYREAFLKALDAIDASGGDAFDKLQSYVDIYARVLARNRMCLCGMLAAEYATLGKPMQTALTSFFDANEQWVTRTLSEGRAQRSLRFDGAAEDLARLLIASLEGAMMLARSYGAPARFHAMARRALADLRADRAPAARPAAAASEATVDRQQGFPPSSSAAT